MRNFTLLTAGAVALSGFCVGSASGAVYFSDDFEGKTDPLGAPDIGIDYARPSATGTPYSLATTLAPALGTTSLKLIRETIHNPNNLVARGNEGALVNGAVVEFAWNNHLEGAHRFNGPIQIGLGFVNGGVGRFTTIGVGDGGNGAYNYMNQAGTTVVATDLTTGAIVRPSLNNGGAGMAQTEWDRVRAVMTLEFVEAGDVDFMTGTMDLFITVGINGVEQQVTNDLPLIYAQIPSNVETTTYDDTTVPQFTIQKGPFSGNTYYDNLFIGNPGSAIPEPTSMALVGAVGLLALRRQRRALN
jgi:hypothetical protein